MKPRTVLKTSALLLLSVLGVAMTLVLTACDTTAEDHFDQRMEMAEEERKRREAPSEPDLAPEKAAELCVSTARELEAKGFDKEAIQQYERAISFNSAYPGIHHRLAILYERQNKPMAALAAYNKAVEKDPQNAELLADMGYFYMNGNQWQLAESRLRLAVKYNAGLKRGWNNLGITLAQQGKVSESLDAFNHAVAPAAAHSNVGVILARRGNYELAREQLNQAIKLDPNLAQARVTLAWINERQGKAAAAATAPAGKGK